MNGTIRFVATHASWFYVFCGLGSAVCLVLFLRAQSGARQALFGLELEMATARRQRALGLFGLIVLVALAVFFITVVVEPRLPSGIPEAVTLVPEAYTPPPTFTNETPTVTATVTPTLTTSVGTPAAQETLTAVPEDEEATPEPSPPATQAPGTFCIIAEPPDGGEVEGEVTFVGSASTEQFLFYKLEAYGPQTEGVWASILGDIVTMPVTNGVLGTANFGGWAAGGYSIRLVIVDTTSNEVASCYISITVPSP